MSRDIDRDLELRTGVVPEATLAERFVENRLRQRSHQSGLLGDGEELVGGEEAPLGMTPADECLDPADGAGAESELRLVVDDELAFLDRPS
jgi:hypothetical protein